MRTRARLIAFVSIAAVTSAMIATLAVAQPRGSAKPAGKPAAKPPAAKADAAAPAPSETAAPASAEGGAPASSAPVEPPPTAAEPVGDGGVRPSPLNPRPEELPGQSNVDAGTPIDYDRLLADIAALRARVAAVSDNLYQSRISVGLLTDGDHGKIARLTVAIDDGIVYTAPQSFAASDLTTVYDHAVAPGRHAVTIEVDRKDDRDDGFRTSQKNRFTVDVPRDHRVAVEVRIIDDSSMGGDFPSDRSGKYDLRLRVKAVARPAGK